MPWWCFPLDVLRPVSSGMLDGLEGPAVRVSEKGIWNALRISGSSGQNHAEDRSISALLYSADELVRYVLNAAEILVKAIDQIQLD